MKEGISIMYRTVYERILPQNKLPVRLMYDPGEVQPWCISYGGGGHYFAEYQDAVDYALGRRFLTWKQSLKALAAAQSKADQEDIM